MSNWRNEDWMTVYRCLVRLIMFYDLEKGRNGGKEFFSIETREAQSLKNKLEIMFRSEDDEHVDTSTKSQMPAEPLPGHGI